METENEPLAHQLHDRVYSSLGMLEQQDLSEDNPDLPGILALTTKLNEKLADMTDIESVTDERARKEAADDDYLPKVIDDFMMAVNLCKTLRVFLVETHDEDGMTAESVVRQIETAVREAWDRVDREDVRRSREARQPAYTEVESEREPEQPMAWRERERQREAAGKIDDNDPGFELKLRLDRVDALLMSLNDITMSGEDRDVLSLVASARSEIAACDRICEAGGTTGGAA